MPDASDAKRLARVVGTPAALFLLAMFAAAALAAVWVWRRAARRRPDPTCGRCGYCVRGVPGWVCPECGSDFKEVGVVAPLGQARLGPRGRAIAWTGFLLLAAPALTAFAYQQRLLPELRGRTGGLMLDGPKSGAYRHVVIGVSSEYRFVEEPPLESWEVFVAPLPTGVRVTQMRYYPRTQTGVYATKDGSRRLSKAPDLAQVLELMEAAGVDPTDPAVRTEAEAVLAEVPTPADTGRPPDHTPRHPTSAWLTRRSPPFATATVTWTEPRRLPEWYWFAIPCLWLVVWILGLRWTLRAKRGGGIRLSKPGVKAAGELQFA